jgi:hypothetical protein
MRWCLLLPALALTSVVAPAPAHARSETDCMSAWSRAVRSYLTQNRRAAPDGTVPQDLDGEELAVQAWLRAFEPACQLETGGRKAEARVEAAAIGVSILARLDPRGCETFLTAYMQSSRPSDICTAARADANVDIRDQIARTIPAR